MPILVSGCFVILLPLSLLLLKEMALPAASADPMHTAIPLPFLVFWLHQQATRNCNGSTFRLTRSTDPYHFAIGHPGRVRRRRSPAIPGRCRRFALAISGNRGGGGVGVFAYLLDDHQIRRRITPFSTSVGRSRQGLGWPSIPPAGSACNCAKVGDSQLPINVLMAYDVRLIVNLLATPWWPASHRSTSCSSTGSSTMCWVLDCYSLYLFQQPFRTPGYRSLRSCFLPLNLLSVRAAQRGHHSTGDAYPDEAAAVRKLYVRSEQLSDRSLSWSPMLRMIL